MNVLGFLLLHGIVISKTKEARARTVHVINQSTLALCFSLCLSVFLSACVSGYVSLCPLCLCLCRSLSLFVSLCLCSVSVSGSVSVSVSLTLSLSVSLALLLSVPLSFSLFLSFSLSVPILVCLYGCTPQLRSIPTICCYYFHSNFFAQNPLCRGSTCPIRTSSRALGRSWGSARCEAGDRVGSSTDLWRSRLEVWV